VIAAVVDPITLIVVNVIMADAATAAAPAGAILVDITGIDAGIGWTYDPGAKTFSAPVAP